MATKSSKKAKFKPSDPSERKAKKTVKAQSWPFAELDEGQTVSGTFQGRRQITIRDRNTKEPKDIYIYTFTDLETGEKFAISGRSMLDQAFDELADEEGGIERLSGEDLRIERGEDERTSGGFRLGTYAIAVLE